MSVPNYLKEDILNYVQDKLAGNDSFILYERAIGSVGLAFRGNNHITDDERKQLYSLIDEIKKIEVAK